LNIARTPFSATLMKALSEIVRAAVHFRKTGSFFMLKTISTKLRAGLMLLAALGAGSAHAADAMTPYSTSVAPATFLQGAQYDLSPGKMTSAGIARDLKNMHDNFNINTLNLYDLEKLSQRERDLLFAQLSSLGMQAVVRIEWYDSTSFAFKNSDVDVVLRHYDALIKDVAGESKRNAVAYFALNMPVDDNGVQKRLGGINSPALQASQVTYAACFVAKMKAKLQAVGFANGKCYLGVFYGWDNAFQVPSYAGANADGYFLNNYTYPSDGAAPPDENQPDAVIIHQTRLQQGMDIFERQYKGKPQVIEYGFHTSEFNGGANPQQIAGLVKTRAAKVKALKATTAFYKGFPDVRGTLYFGYNLLKQEGIPPAMMDWCLAYPETPGAEKKKAE
jgi:hypothetical protein